MNDGGTRGGVRSERWLGRGRRARGALGVAVLLTSSFTSARSQVIEPRDDRLTITGVDGDDQAVSITAATWVGFEQYDATDHFRSLLELVREKGTPLTQDHRGTWRSELLATHAWLVVESESGRGVAEVAPGQRCVEVLLRPRVSAQVQALDHLGQFAAGVAVQLMRRFEDGGWGLELGETWTSVRGVAGFEGLELLRPTAPGEFLAVVPMVVGVERLFAAIPAGSGRHELTLALPPTRSLVCDVINLPAECVESSVSLTGAAGPLVVRPVQKGCATFHFVALDVPLEATWLDGTFKAVHVAPLTSGQGPVRQALEVEAPRVTPTHVRLELLDGTGQPLAGEPVVLRRLEVFKSEVRSAFGKFHFTTDAKGWVECHDSILGKSPGWLLKAHGRRSFLSISTSADGPPWEPTPHSLIPLPIEGHADGVWIVQSAVVERTGLSVLRGEVIDDLGAPVSGVEVDLALRIQGVECSLPSMFSSVSDTDGRFVIHAPAAFKPEAVILRVRDEGWIGDVTIEGAPSEVEATLRVRRGPALSFPAPVVEYPRHGWCMLDWAIVSEETGDVASSHEEVFADPMSRRVRHSDLEPGRYGIVFTYAGAEVARFAGVQVTGGADTDPRLEAWDVRQSVQTARLRVLDEHGHEPDGLTVAYSPRGGTEELDGWERMWWASNHAEFDLMMIADEPADVRIDADGYCTEWLAMRGDEVVQLRPAVMARLRVQPKSEWPELAWKTRLAVRCIPVQDSAEAFRATRWLGEGHHSIWTLGQDGFALALEPGEYALRWCVVSVDDETDMGVGVRVLDDASRTFFRVDDGGNLPLLRLPANLRRLAEQASRELAVDASDR